MSIVWAWRKSRAYPWFHCSLPELKEFDNGIYECLYVRLRWHAGQHRFYA